MYKHQTPKTAALLDGQQLVKEIYDKIIANCKEKKMVQTNFELQNLIDILDFENIESQKKANDFFWFYRSFQQKAREGKFKEVIDIIIELQNLSVPIKILTG